MEKWSCQFTPSKIPLMQLVSNGGCSMSLGFPRTHKGVPVGSLSRFQNLECRQCANEPQMPLEHDSAGTDKLLGQRPECASLAKLAACARISVLANRQP